VTKPPEIGKMIYVLAALLPPLGLLLNGQPFSAIFNLVLIVFCLLFGWIFHVLLLVPSVHAVILVHIKREQRMHREVVDAIRRRGPPPGYPR
jgi:type IV secretory pathway VirB3-like protein